MNNRVVGGSKSNYKLEEKAYEDNAWLVVFISYICFVL